MLTFTNKFAESHCTYKNDHSGRANIGCLIYSRDYVYSYEVKLTINFSLYMQFQN